MSSHADALGRVASRVLFRARAADDCAEKIRPAATQGEYSELIDRLFPGTSVVALIGSHLGAVSRAVSAADGSAANIAPIDPDDRPDRVSRIASNLAQELDASGRQVVIVPLFKLLQMTPWTVPLVTAFTPGKSPRIRIWPALPGDKIEFFESSEPTGPCNWLDFLRRNFDSVLLDCPSLDAATGVAEVAAMADFSVLAVEAGQTSKEQIQRDQRILQLIGAQVAGYILIQRSSSQCESCSSQTI